MKISDFLTPADIVIDMRTSQKRQVLQKLARKVAVGLDLDGDYIASELLKREALGSTGMGNGAAIPHARLPTVTRPRGVLARLKPAVEFEAIDGEPVDLVFLLLLPGQPDADQLVALALVARRLKVPDVLTQLRRVKSTSELYAAITGEQGGTFL